MKKTLLVTILILACCSLTFAASDKKRVAVLDFDFGSVQQWWSGTWDIGKGVSDQIVTKLVENGTFRVIERSRLDQVLGEQEFSNSDRANATTAAQIGKVLGVNAIIVGSITQFGTEKKKKGFGGALGNWGGYGAGKVGTTKGKANVAIDARIVDIDTAEILAVAKGVGQSSRSGLLLGGSGGGSGGWGGGGIDMGSSDFRETILGEAVDMATADVVAKLVAQSDRLPDVQINIEGLVADVDGFTVILNIGSSHGLSVGMTLEVVKVTRVVKDPATGKVLREVVSSVGSIRVDEVDAGSSVGTIISGEGIQVGDKVVGGE